MLKNRSGFTIVELLIVIVVIGILAVITIVAYNGMQQRGKIAVVQSDLKNAQTALLADYAITGSLPTSTSNANDGKGLKPSNGTSFQYTVNSSVNPPTFCLTAINGSVAYRITQSGPSTEGICSGHTGPVTGGVTCEAGFIKVPGNSNFGTSDFCVAKYEAKNVGAVATSQASGTPWVSISQATAVSKASSACSGCHLITEGEWMTIAANVLLVNSNWSGGSVGSGYIYSGHNDNSPANSLAASNDDNDGYSGTGNSSVSTQRRTLTLNNGEVIWDISGNVLEWTQGTIGGSQQPGISGEGGYAWKQWNDSLLLMHGLPSSSQPNSIPGVASWSSTQGIGQLNSWYGNTVPGFFIRSGSWTYGANAGVLTLFIDDEPGFSHSTVGFRVAR